jgi:hypothetical protein
MCKNDDSARVATGTGLETIIIGAFEPAVKYAMKKLYIGANIVL